MEGNVVFLSFIIPVYNTEEYLEHCIQSLLEQDISQEEYEIICINDGSSDGSLEILKHFSQNCKNFVVVDQKNSGVCTARNKGLDVARGEYIWFIDSDDFIQKNILGTLMKQATNTQCERLVISHYFFEDVTNGDEEQICEAKLKVNTSWKDSVVWRSLFKKEFLIRNNLKFHYEDLVYGEDALFMYEVKRCMPKSIEISYPVYFHRVRTGSASTDISYEMERKRVLSAIHEAVIMKNYYENSEKTFEVETANRFMSFLWGALFRIASLPKKEAKLMLGELKKVGLYPYKRPEECTITKSFQFFKNKQVEELFDKIYISIHTIAGYHIMRCWLNLRKAKSLLAKMKRRIVEGV